MKLSAKKTDFKKTKTACLILFVNKSTLSPVAKSYDTQLNGEISAHLKALPLDAAIGSTRWLTTSNANTPRILLVQADETTLKEKRHANLRTLAASIEKAAAQASIKSATLELDTLSLALKKEEIRTLCAALEGSTYQYTQTKPSAKEKASTKLALTLGTAKADYLNVVRTGTVEGLALGHGINITKELGNLPGNICTPSYLAEQAKLLSKQNPAVTTRILTEKQMDKLGMHSLLSVSHGSDEEAKFIIMEYKAGAKSQAPDVLVGKGITFDTGGISLKPGAGMDEMKYDMCGAASVFGTLTALVEMKAKVNVIGVVAAAENMPSGRATKPGDVVTSMSGQTIEILNTDAEGRLVLCDALTYVERFKPRSVVDIATLTGACIVALGSHTTGLFSNDQKLADSLLATGEKIDDKAWQFPIWDEYHTSLKSNFADIANIGGREAGSITAACFLSKFTKKYAWAHLDIAGSAWKSGAAKGATGRPVSLLVDYLLNR